MREHLPIDPECPEAQVEVFQAAEDLDNDPISIHYGFTSHSEGDYERMENAHRKNCNRCMEYGLANIEVV